MTRPVVEDASSTPYQTNAATVTFYLVDINTVTVSQAWPDITLPSDKVPQITDFMGAAFEHRDYYSIFTHHARSFFISDVDGKIIATIYDVICTMDGYPEFLGECYRARMFDGNELTSLIDVGFQVANS